MATRVSLAELIDADVSIRPDEAVAIVREVCRQHAAGELRGIPNATVIRLTPDGRIAVEGPVSRDQDPVRAAATLLGDLLPTFHSPTGFKVPGGLRLVLARATRALDLPPFADVAEFCAALERFTAPDAADTVRRLFAAWTLRRAQVAASQEAPELTISDVRRARRATGLSLEDISRASDIPAAKLRELEWGYMRHWRADAEGREALGRYARAAGVDENLVTAVAWPLIESASHDPVVDVTPVAADEWALVPIVSPKGSKPRGFLAGYRSLLALAAAILLVVTVMMMGWERSAPGDQPTDARVEAAAVPAPTSGSTTTVTDEPGHDARRASFVKPAGARPKTARSKARPAPAPQRKSFFKRELFRIVIK